MSEVHNEERHPNGVPKTIHHFDATTGKPVYHHEVVEMDHKELVALGHSAAEATAMINEAKPNKAKGKSFTTVNAQPI